MELSSSSSSSEEDEEDNDEAYQKEEEDEAYQSRKSGQVASRARKQTNTSSSNANKKKAKSSPKSRESDSKRSKQKDSGSKSSRNSSIGCIGAVIPVGGSINVVSPSNPEMMGSLIIHNISDHAVTLPPGLKTQTQDNKLYSTPRVFAIPGDDKEGAYPLAWGQADEVKIEIIVPNVDLLPGGKRALPDDVRDRLMSPARWSMEEIIASIPAVPGSEGKQATTRNYLGFRRGCWQVATEQRCSGVVEAGVTADLIAHVARGRIVNRHTCTADEYATVTTEVLPKAGGGWVSCAFILNHAPPVAASGVASQPPVMAIPPSLKDFVKVIGTSGNVSLLQKVIILIITFEP